MNSSVQSGRSPREFCTISLQTIDWNKTTDQVGEIYDQEILHSLTGYFGYKNLMSFYSRLKNVRYSLCDRHIPAINCFHLKIKILYMCLYTYHNCLNLITNKTEDIHNLNLQFVVV